MAIKKKISKWLFSLGFLLCAIASWIDASDNLKNILSSPSPIGFTLISIISILNSLEVVGDNWMISAMTFLIVTKIISHISHGSHLNVNAWGLENKHKEHKVELFAPLLRLTSNNTLKLRSQQYINPPINFGGPIRSSSYQPLEV